MTTLSRMKTAITFSRQNDASSRASTIKYWRITFTANSEREFVPRQLSFTVRYFYQKIRSFKPGLSKRIVWYRFYLLIS